MHSSDPTVRVQRDWQRELPDSSTDPIAITRRIAVCARLLSNAQRNTLARHCMDPPTFDLLAVLCRSGPPYRLTPSELVERSLVSPATLTQRVTRAERAGVVTVARTTGGRTSAVTLTDEGHRSVTESMAGLLTAQGNLVSSLPTTQRTELAALLQTLLKGLHRHLGTPDLGDVER